MLLCGIFVTVQCLPNDIDVAYVVKDSSGKFSIVKITPDEWVAKAEFSNKVNETGYV